MIRADGLVDACHDGAELGPMVPIIPHIAQKQCCMDHLVQQSLLQLLHRPELCVWDVIKGGQHVMQCTQEVKTPVTLVDIGGSTAHLADLVCIMGTKHTCQARPFPTLLCAARGGWGGVGGGGGDAPGSEQHVLLLMPRCLTILVSLLPALLRLWGRRDVQKHEWLCYAIVLVHSQLTPAFL